MKKYIVVVDESWYFYVNICIYKSLYYRGCCEFPLSRDFPLKAYFVEALQRTWITRQSGIYWILLVVFFDPKRTRLPREPEVSKPSGSECYENK